MARRKWYRKKRYSKKNIDIESIFWLIIWLSILTVYAYKMYILPNIEILKHYLFILLIILLFILIIFLFYKIIRRRKNNKIELERKVNIPSFLLDLETKIKEFKPIRQYKEELLYQTELVWFLKNNYPDVEIEQTRNFSRPDIIIDDIAIEIKWPTNMAALKTLPDKINSYLPKWDYLFIVLFNIDIVSDKEKNIKIYEEKKQQILDNTIEYKRERIFFIEI